MHHPESNSAAFLYLFCRSQCPLFLARQTRCSHSPLLLMVSSYCTAELLYSWLNQSFELIYNINIISEIFLCSIILFERKETFAYNFLVLSIQMQIKQSSFRLYENNMRQFLLCYEALLFIICSNMQLWIN